MSQETLGAGYVRTARAKELAERSVVLRHGLRSALTTVVSQLGIDVGILLGGVMVVENVPCAPFLPSRPVSAKVNPSMADPVSPGK